VICLSQSDTALISRCQGKDITAFDQIVVRYKHKIFNYIFRMVGDSDEAEDLTQEVFVKTYVSLASFRSESSLNTWLYRIAGNLCIDSHRKRRRRQNALGGAVLSLNESPSTQVDTGEESAPTRDVGDRSFEPYNVLAQQELDGQIQKALAQLPEKMRTVVVLHDLEDLPYEEIAAIVGCPLGTVKSRLFNARLQLRDLLRPYLEA
jgi:RNA polymerase sigma-70 factor (ECF subfamily)